MQHKFNSYNYFLSYISELQDWKIYVFRTKEKTLFCRDVLQHLFQSNWWYRCPVLHAGRSFFKFVFTAISVYVVILNSSESIEVFCSYFSVPVYISKLEQDLNHSKVLPSKWPHSVTTLQKSLELPWLMTENWNEIMYFLRNKFCNPSSGQGI